MLGRRADFEATATHGDADGGRISQRLSTSVVSPDEGFDGLPACAASTLPGAAAQLAG